MIASSFTKTTESDGAYEVHNQFVGFGEASIVNEDQIYPEKNIKQGDQKIITNEKRGFRISVSVEAIEDNRFAPIAGEVGKASRLAMDQTRERDAINLLNNGFGTSDKTTPDGVALFSASHVLVAGGTQTNTATAAALDPDSLWAGINVLKDSKDDSGLNLHYTPECIVVPTALFRRANELTRSGNMPLSMNREDNVVKQLYPLEVKDSPLLTSSTAWFLFAKPSKVIYYGIIRQQRKALAIKPLFRMDSDEEIGLALERDAVQWKVSERYAHDLIHWHGTFGNSGA